MNQLFRLGPFSIARLNYREGLQAMAIGESWYCGVRFLYSNLAGTSSQVPHYIGRHATACNPGLHT